MFAPWPDSRRRVEPWVRGSQGELPPGWVVIRGTASRSERGWAKRRARPGAGQSELLGAIVAMAEGQPERGGGPYTAGTLAGVLGALDAPISGLGRGWQGGRGWFRQARPRRRPCGRVSFRHFVMAGMDATGTGTAVGGVVLSIQITRGAAADGQLRRATCCRSCTAGPSFRRWSWRGCFLLFLLARPHRACPQARVRRPFPAAEAGAAAVAAAVAAAWDWRAGEICFQ